MDQNPFWYKPVRFFFYFFEKIIFRMRVLNADRFPKTGAVVLACNHVSLADPPLVGTASPRRVNVMAKSELFVPVLGSLYKLLGAFPVRRGASDRAAIKHGIDVLKKGQCLMIFPEGTRSRDGKLGKAQPGALMMASKARAAIVPTCIVGTDFKREKCLWPKVTISFGEPIYFPQEGEITKDMLHEMTEEMMRRIGAEIEAVKHAD